jgi:hypothetical protein
MRKYARAVIFAWSGKSVAFLHHIVGRRQYRSHPIAGAQVRLWQRASIDLTTTGDP